MERKGSCLYAEVSRYEVQSFVAPPLKILTMSFLAPVVTHVASGRILRIDGGVPKRHDKKIYDESGLVATLRENERGIADKGYIGAARLLVPYRGEFLTADKVEWNRKVASVRILTERTNGLLKKFLAFNTRWRGSYTLHRLAFRFIAHLTNIDIELHPIQPYLNTLLTDTSKSTSGIASIVRPATGQLHNDFSPFLASYSGTPIKIST